LLIPVDFPFLAYGFFTLFIFYLLFFKNVKRLQELTAGEKNSTAVGLLVSADVASGFQFFMAA
jgi:hypothetical protein